MQFWTRFRKWRTHVLEVPRLAMKILLGWVLILCLLPGAANARQLGSPFSVGDIVVTVDRLTAGNVGRGFVPVRVRAENKEKVERSLQVSFAGGWTNGMARSRFFTTMTLGPGESNSLELLVPASRNPGATLSKSLMLNSDGHQNFVDLGICDEGFNSKARVICVLAESQLSEAEVAAIKGDLPMDRGGTAQGVFDNNKISGGSSRRGGAGQAAQVFSLAFVDLPEHTAGWSSVDTVLVKVTGPIRGDRRWNRILEWVRQGGQVAFVGQNLEQNLKGIEGLAALAQERFRVELEGAGDFYSAGFGTIAIMPPLYAPKSLLDDPSDLAEYLVLLDKGDGSHAGLDDLPSNLATMYKLEAGRGPWKKPFPSNALPLRAVVSILLLFSIVVGPINVFLVKKKQKPWLLFVSVPVISIIVTVLIVVFGFLRQGFGTEGYANSVVIVDQVSHQATAALRRRLVVGSGGPALSPRPNTTVLVPDEGVPGAVRIVQEKGNQLRLSGDFLPVRTQTNHLILTSAATVRARLEFQRQTDGTLKVTNGLGVSLRSLEVRAPDGSIYTNQSPVALGASQILKQASKARLEADVIAHELDPMFRFAKLPACGYLAIASSASDIADDCSVEMEELLAIHVVVGFLDDSPQRWKP